MHHLIGAAVLIWIAWNYDIWTAIGWSVFVTIVFSLIYVGMGNIAAWWWLRAEEKATRPPRPSAPLPQFSGGPSEVWQGFIYVVAIVLVSLLVMTWFTPHS